MGINGVRNKCGQSRFNCIFYNKSKGYLEQSTMLEKIKEA